MAAKPKKLQAPVLMAYVREQPSYPRWSPSWAPALGWIVFALSLAVLEERFDASLPGVFLSIALGVGTTAAVRHSARPKNHRERAEEQVAWIIRRLKDEAESSRLHKIIPPDVLTALERAATTRTTIVTRLQAFEPGSHVGAIHSLDDALDACLRASGPVIRRDAASRREWEALLENREMLGAVVETIDLQTERMRNEIDPSQERSQALQELDSALYRRPRSEGPRAEQGSTQGHL